jgi:hypothetical protein
VVIVDACHSGSMVLGLNGDGRPPLEVTIHGVPHAGPAPRGYYRLTLAACPDDKVAVDAAMGEGAVTSTMLDVLHAESPATYRELWSRVATHIDRQYCQDGVGTPQIDSLGPDDRLLSAPPFVFPPF